MPNVMLTAHADRILGRNGRMIRAVEALGVHHELVRVGDVLARDERGAHALVAHADAVAHRDGVEDDRLAAGLIDRRVEDVGVGADVDVVGLRDVGGGAHAAFDARRNAHAGLQIDIAVGADLIAGFPTEDEAAHMANLSIVRELCKLLGGEVTVESEVGKGSTFTVLIPWSRAEVGRGDSLTTGSSSVGGGSGPSESTTAWSNASANPSTAATPR